MKKVVLVVTIDTECDKGLGWKIPYPILYSSVTEAIPNVFQPLCDEYNIKPTYLLSPEIIKDLDSVNVLKKIKNCELGTHLHGEFVEPELVASPGRTSTPQLEYSVEIEKGKLQTLTNLFEEKFGYSPLSFRAGRWGASSSTLGLLESLGYAVDSSVAPFTTHEFTKSAANYYGAPLQPYFPSFKDIRRIGKRKILQVPATIIHPQMMYWPRILLRQLNGKSKIHKKVLGKLGYASKITWLRPYRSSAEDMIALTKQVVKRFSKEKVVVLNMMFHSNELVVKGSPYVQSDDELASFLQSLATYFSYLNENYEFESLGLSEVKKYFS
jgi:hypothetical protein